MPPVDPWNGASPKAKTPLTFAQVDTIRERFSDLNPYDRAAVPDVLKLETQAHCYAISAKRYALYSLDDHGDPVFVHDDKLSKHGLGHFLNPANPGSDGQAWIKDLWRMIISKAHGRATEPPEWMYRPTMVRTTITSPAVLRAFRRLNEGRTYAESMKPFNFVMSVAGAKPPAGVPMGEPFRLVGPFESDPRKWEGRTYIDVHHPGAGPYPLTTKDGRPGMARADTFAEVLAKYETHPEAKSLGPNGEPCGRATVGLLQRRPVIVGKIDLIGKESNRLEERSRGEAPVNDRDERITTYDDHDEWYRVTVPRLREIGVKAVAQAVGMSELNRPGFDGGFSVWVSHAASG